MAKPVNDVVHVPGDDPVQKTSSAGDSAQGLSQQTWDLMAATKLDAATKFDMSPKGKADLDLTLPKDGLKSTDAAAPTGDVNADGVSTQAIPSKNWLQTGFMSYHLDRKQTHERNFREQNYGIGIEHKLSENSSISAGYYRNSIDKDSFYAAYAYQPLKVGPVKVGAMAGVVTGYHLNNGGPIPMVLPLASIEGKRMGVNLTYVPKLKDVSSVVALQFKFALDK